MADAEILLDNSKIPYTILNYLRNHNGTNPKLLYVSYIGKNLKIGSGNMIKGVNLLLKYDLITEKYNERRRFINLNLRGKKFLDYVYEINHFLLIKKDVVEIYLS